MCLGRKKHSQKGSRGSVLTNRRRRFGSEQEEKNALVYFFLMQKERSFKRSWGVGSYRAGKLHGFWSGKVMFLFEPAQGVCCFSERVLNQFREKEWILCPQCRQTLLAGGKGTKAVQRIASLNSRGQVDGRGKRHYQPMMKRPVQLQKRKRTIMANPPANEVDSDAISNQPGLSPSTDSHFSKISIWNETENKGRRQRGCLKWIILSLLKSDGWPAITQPSWDKSQAVTSCFHK